MDELELETYEQAHRDYSRLGWALLATALLTPAVQLLLLFIVGLLAKAGYDLTGSSLTMWCTTFAPLYLVGFPVGYLLLRRVPAEEHGGIPLGGKNLWIFFLMCFPIMYGGNIIGILLSSFLSNGTAENGLEVFVADSLPLKLLVIVILAPLTEEFIFRKQLIDRCHRYGEKMAILFSALMFGLFHMNLFQFFYAFGLGLLFGYVYTRTGRLRYTIILHMLVNFIGSVLSPAVLTMADMESMGAMVTSGADGAELMAAFTGASLMVVYVILLLAASVSGLILLITKASKLRFVPCPQELPQGQRFKAVFCSAGVILFILFCTAVCILQLI